ncbi:MAG: hypothetical protein AAGB31_16020, partial [Bdellovibrio sp.]
MNLRRPFIFKIGLWTLLLQAGLWTGAQAQVQTEMRLFSDSFLSPAFEATEKTNYQFIGAQMKSDPLTKEGLKMDISGGVAMGAPLLNYLNVSEFYVEKEQTEGEVFYIGRKKLLWNEMDARWDL